MSKFVRLAICFSLTVGWVLNLHAAIIFDFGPVTRVTPGGQGAVAVYVTGTDDEPLEAYDLPIDIGGDGLGFPAGVSFAGVDISNDDFAEEINTFGEVIISGTDPLPPGPPFDPRFDAVFSDDGPTILLSSTRRHLFNILLDIPADFVGPIPVEFAVSGFPELLSVTSGTTDLTQSQAGVLELRSGTITSIPEPGAWSVVAMVLSAMAARRR